MNRWTTKSLIERALLRGGEGTRAIIYGSNNKSGYVWNAVVQNGKVNYIDGRIGGGGLENVKHFSHIRYGILP